VIEDWNKILASLKQVKNGKCFKNGHRTSRATLVEHTWREGGEGDYEAHTAHLSRNLGEENRFFVRFALLAAMYPKS
jgi:hypothetical protein